MKKNLSKRTRIKYYFKQDDFDFFFQWILGSATHGGVETGECFYVASKIKDGDTESWGLEWTELAEKVEKRAKASLEKNHLESAKQSYFRAYNYFRAPLLFMNPKDSRYKKIYETARKCFLKAATMFKPKIKSIAINFEGKYLNGYFLKTDKNSKPKKTLIMFGGGDSFVEDLYFYIGPSGLKRDYNIFIIDLPGQGILPDDGLIMMPDSEKPMKAIIDHVAKYPEVDMEKLAVFGISAGGYLIPRAATKEKRIKACIASSVILNFYEVWSKNTSLEKIAKMEKSWLMKMVKMLPFRKVQVLQKFIDTYCWRWGINSVSELLEISKKFVFDPKDITCPTLVLIGKQEYDKFPASRDWAHNYLEKANTNHKDLIITPQDEGADGHAIGTNLSLMSQSVFDWLDEIFKS
jgi:alpha-beta hydrolase superfamily lysophospholipase